MSSLRQMLPKAIPPELSLLQGPLQDGLVRLEPLGPQHVSGLREAAEDREIFRWMPDGDLTGSEAMWRFAEDALEAAGAGLQIPFVILHGDRVAGSTRYLEIRLEHLRVEVGWTWLARSAWGSGVNVRTKLLLLGRAFDRAGLRRVEFKTDARNERSRGALLALGARFEGIHRRHMVLPDGSSRDSAYFSVIAEEWPELRTRQRQRLEEA